MRTTIVAALGCLSTVLGAAAPDLRVFCDAAHMTAAVAVRTMDPMNKATTTIAALLFFTACGHPPADPRAPVRPAPVDVQCADAAVCGEGDGCHAGQCVVAHCTQSMCDAIVPGFTCRWLGPGTDPRCCTGASQTPADGDVCCDVRENPDCSELEPR